MQLDWANLLIKFNHVSPPPQTSRYHCEEGKGRGRWPGGGAHKAWPSKGHWLDEGESSSKFMSQDSLTGVCIIHIRVLIYPSIAMRALSFSIIMQKPPNPIPIQLLFGCLREKTWTIWVHLQRWEHQESPFSPIQITVRQYKFFTSFDPV